MVKKNKKSTPLRAIRQQCLDCCGGSAKEVKNCTGKECSLYYYRFGRNPHRKKRALTEEQKIEITKILLENKNDDEKTNL